MSNIKLTINKTALNANDNLYGNLTFNITIINILTNFTVNRTLSQQFQKLSGGEIEFTGGLNATDPSTVNQYIQTVINPFWMGIQPGCNGVFIKGVVKIEENAQPDVFIHYSQVYATTLPLKFKMGTVQLSHSLKKDKQFSNFSPTLMKSPVKSGFFNI